MGWEADSAHSLAVKDQAAEEVGKKIDGLVAKLEEYRSNLQGNKSNLGMNGSKEGDTWNDKVDDALLAIHNKLGEFIESAKKLATAAHTMQTQCKNIEDSAAAQFTELSRTAGYPPKPA